MSTSVSTSTPHTSSRQNPSEATNTQFSVGPDFRDVATVLLRKSLQKLYPALDIDPSVTLLGTPSWEIVDDEIVAGPTQYQTLTEILAIQAVLAVPALYIEGEHFLTQQPMTEPPIHLPVRIDEIATMINLQAPLMLTAFQEQTVEYWNKVDGSSEPHWRELSYTLQSFWNVDKVQGWDDDDCKMALTFFRAPDPATRALDDPFQSKAYLVSLDPSSGQDEKGIIEKSIVVLIGKHKEKTVILSHSLLTGYEKFDSLEQFGATLPAYVHSPTPQQEIQWRLVEPSGNPFDHQACALISRQIEIIGALDLFEPRNFNPGKPDATPDPEIDEPGPGLEWFKDALPDWLSSASHPDLSNYSRHLKNLAALHSQNAGKSYLDGIVPIQEYALDVLKTEMGKDHAIATQPDLDAIEIRVRTPVIWGLFPVPGKIDTFTFSMADLALQNLIALPLGEKTLHSSSRKPLPEWMTVKYVEELISQADIGKTYPALIKAKLLDNASESLRRKTLFTQHLRIQLPLLALQCKIREQAGIDTLGYRYVVAVMEPDVKNRIVDGQTIVMRPLAFVPKRRTDGAEDVVANMFVIGPQNPASGPCLLYRPMLDQPLTQYPSPANLLYAIQQSASLRESVLAWLPDDVRSDYANYVFPGALPSPWTVADFLVDPDKLTTMTGPMGVGEKVVEGDLFSALFKANANALVELADRQSISNAESRWATFKKAGWMMFNAVLPFLGRTVGIAAWIWQVMDELQQLHDAQEQSDKPAQWEALTDLLLNLGTAITLHIATRSTPGNRPANSKPTTEPAKTAEPNIEAPVKKTVTVKQLASTTPKDMPETQQTLSASGALNQAPGSLAIVLNRFQINRPAKLGSANAKEGTHQHLYSLDNKWYAPVGERWFEVSVDDNGTVLIIDSGQPTRTGPALISNPKGQWFVDTRLRLRGGGSTTRFKVAETQAALKAKELRTKLTAFESRKAIAQKELQQAHLAMSIASVDTAPAMRQRYLQKLESLRAEYATALEHLKTLHVFSPTADYQHKALGYLKAQLELIHAGIREALTPFTPKMRSILDQIERQAEVPHERRIEDARHMSEMNQDMTMRLQNVESRIDELKAFKKEGMRMVQQTRSLLPAYSIDDLKALQVTMSRNLCLRENTVTTVADAWSTLDQIVDTADIAVQTLRDILDERSVARLDERIDSLNDLIEQFNILDERLVDFRSAYTAHVLEEPLTRLRQQLDEFKKRAASNLVVVNDERDSLRASPSLPLFKPRPKKKFFKTRFNGVLIGEPRLTEQGLETDLVDITSPLTRKVIATYHEKNGVWVRQIRTSATRSTIPDLQTSINNGQTLLDKLPAFNARMTELLSSPGRSPGGIEFLFQQYVMHLEQASSTIDEALTDNNETESRTLSAAQVNKALSETIDNLNQQATAAKLKITKQQPPTLSGIAWLKNQRAISIEKTITRRRIKGGKDLYLDEYTVRDSTRNILWYAHFLYSTSWVPEKAFVYGRLKTVQEKNLGLAADTSSGLNEQQRLAYYRSMIGVEQARQLFFSAG